MKKKPPQLQCSDLLSLCMFSDAKLLESPVALQSAREKNEGICFGLEPNP